MPRYSDDVDDAEFLSPEILRVADTPSPVKPLPTSSYAAMLATSNQPARTSLQSQFATMQPHATSAPSTRPTTTPVPSSTRPVPPSAFVPPQPAQSAAQSAAARSSPYFARPAPLASALDAPTLSDFFGDSPRGMSTVITLDSLSPQKPPPTSQRQHAAPASSLAPVRLDGLPLWKSKGTSGVAASSGFKASLSSLSSSSSSSSLGRSDDVIDLAGDDDPRITSPKAARSSLSSSLSSITAHSEKQLNDLLHSPRKSQSTKHKNSRSKLPRHLHVTVQLVAPSTVGITAQPDDQRVTDIVRNVSGAVWDEKRRMWTCRVSAVKALVTRFEALGSEDSEVTVDAPDERLLAEERRREAGMPAAGSTADDEEKQPVLKQYEWFTGLPPKLRRALYPFQLDGVDFALQHEGKVLIGDEMGLGKTLQGIAIASLYYDEWPCLIVCPSSLRLNWKNELTRWLPTLHSREIQVIMSGKDRLLHRALHWTTRFTIISYDLVIKFEPSIKKANYACIICDESHYLKSLTAKRTKALLPILKRAKHCILLSGTPALSRPIELYNQISVLSEKFGSYHDFGMRYAKGRKGRFGWEYKGAANLAELHFLLKEHVMIRRLKEEVLTELRPKQRTAVMVAIDDKEVEAKCKRLAELKDMASKLVGAADSAAPLSGFTQEKRNELFEMYRKSGEAKLSSIIQYISDLLENDCKFLVFAHHLSVLDGIENYLKTNRYAFFRLDGSTSPADRQKGVDWFQSDAKCKVALLSITAGGTGLTLTASSTVVFAELVFTPALLLQAEDRVHRIGQPNAVNIHYLLGRHSLDDMLWPLLVRKMAVVGSTLDGEESALEFQGTRGGETDQDKARFNVGQKGLARWLEREEQRKADIAKREAALKARRDMKWRDAIEIGDEEDAAMEAEAGEEKAGLSADREAELDEQVRDEMWVFVSDEDDGFIADEEEEAEDEGEGEAKYKEDKEDDEDQDERFDSDEDYEQPEERNGNHAYEEGDEDDGEAEYQPKHYRGKKRVIRSDDELEERDVEAEDEVKLLSNNSLTPLSSSSSVSSASVSHSQWAGAFGIDSRTIEDESRIAQVRRAREEARQKEMHKRQRRVAAVEEEDDFIDDDEDVAPVRRKPSAASRSARDNRSRRAAVEEEPADGENEEDDQAEAEGGMQYNESDLTLLLLGMGYTVGQVQSVLNELRDDTHEGQMFDVNAALETLIRLGHTQQPTAQRSEEKKEAADDGDSVPCERCGELVSFYDYTTHLGHCRRLAAAAQRSTAASAAIPASKPPRPRKRAESIETKEAPTLKQPPNDDVEAAAESEVEEEQVRKKAPADRRRRIIDLDDQEQVEEQIVTSQERDKRGDGTGTDDDSIVEDEVNVEWLDE